jgi:nickel transport system ATP-binding protein
LKDLGISSALEIDDLRIVLAKGEVPIINGLSFVVPAGRTVALVGESGSGKTMTSMAVMGLLPQGVLQTGGRIVLGGLPVGSLSAEEHRRLRNTAVAMVMQNPMSAFDPVQNISYHFRETLASHGSVNKKEIRTKAIHGLEAAGFPDPRPILELYPFQMSGGMLQRVMLAIALISSPQLVIADEATSDLDVLSQARILKLLKERCGRSGSALLLITHDLSVAASMADEVVLIKEGKLVEKNAVDVFFRKPQTQYAAKLLDLHRGLYSRRFIRIIKNITEGVFS